VKVLIVGSGAREHAIAEALSRSRHSPEIHAFMSSQNPGIISLSKSTKTGNISDAASVVEFAKGISPDFAVIGPEAPLQAGVVDALQEAGIPSVGPLKELAKIETSKSFTRELMQRFGIPGLPVFNVFKSTEGMLEFMRNIGKVVVKPDGLTGGKGVKVQGDHFETYEEAMAYAEEILREHEAVVVEEKLEGEEFSLQSFCDGRRVVDCPPAQDHKRAYEGDEGPNTGGMGSYSDKDMLLPFLDQSDVKEAHKITEMIAVSLYRETGRYYKGILYGGFIATANGVKLIEYNARFGDPEAMNVLPLLETDFVDVCLAMIKGSLDSLDVRFSNKATVCKYVVPKGYPENPAKGEPIEIGEMPDNARLYYASVNQENGKLLMTGSRAVAFVGIADTLEEAERIAQKALESVKGNVFFRSDIGTRELIQKRVRHMQSLRNKT